MKTNDKSNKNRKVPMQGNIALCEGAIAGGCDAYYGYPITPQNEVASYMSKKMPESGRIFLQSESELSAINMVFGSALAGKRAMTSSSSPGISLMQETISYLCGCELPCVIANIQRGGPGLGNIAGSQADYFQSVKGGGHGDYRMITLAPAGVQEMYDFALVSFKLAEKYRNPVMILSDGYTGQMMEPVELKSYDSVAGDSAAGQEKYLPDWVLDGCKGREPRKIRSLIMEEGALEKHNYKLARKYQNIRENEVLVDLDRMDDAEVAIVAFGIAARVAKSAVDIARDAGIRAGIIRPITLWPFPEKEIFSITQKIKKILVAEMNMGQMVEDVRLASGGLVPVKFIGRPGGGIFTPEEIYEHLKKII
ncbi:MAG: 3-methyl-2-oxobutanoate dehydrogenase subunit VorB [Elusimicrobia bacterium]|nr:3-methyl-2-oxobutanoate dehydrogenase subunit VorB [Elusimicrobiota bacterium]